MVNLNYNFKNKKLLKTALTHRSFLNESRGVKESNERIEFLGDAVLELVVSLYLYKKYPGLPEGKLTFMRSRLVQTKTLSLAAERLKLGVSLQMSKGEKDSGGEKNPSLLADVFEAVVGAIYLDSGLNEAFSFVEQNLLFPAEKMLADKLPRDYKSKFQELIQAKGLPTPVYKIMDSFGPDHNKTFVTKVFVGKKVYAKGKGSSKQEAEQMAAKKALEKVGLK